VFVRWGNETAPPGTSLVYNGFAFNSHHAHHGGSTTLCLASAESGDPLGHNGDLLYSAQTASSNLPPGILSSKKLKCAVVFAGGPTVLMWGSSRAPEGWDVAYAGYAMSGHFTFSNPAERICVDSADFDGSVSSSSSESIYFGTRLHSTSGLDAYQPGTAVPCAVLVKQ
jgi:hypothetical protein